MEGKNLVQRTTKMIELLTRKNSYAIYNKSLASLVDSALGAAMLGVVTERAMDLAETPVVLFPFPTEHKNYVIGESWKEILALNTDEMKIGMQRVGTRCPSSEKVNEILNDVRPDFDFRGKLINSRHLIAYYSSKGQYNYVLNKELLEKALELKYTGMWPDFVKNISEPVEQPHRSRPSEEDMEKMMSGATYKDLKLEDLVGGNNAT